MSVAMALAQARHHTAPRGQKTARAEATYDALWSQRPSVAGDTEFFSLYEEELGRTRLDRLAGVRPQARVQRHTAEHSVDVSPSVQTLDAPVQQMGNELLDIFKFVDTVLTEQVIDVPKISQDIIPQRLVDPDLRPTQTAEHLVEVPSILYILKQKVDIPVPRVFSQNRIQQRSPSGSSLTFQYKVEVFKVYAQDRVPQPHLLLLTLQLVFDDADEAFQRMFRTFPRPKKSARLTQQVSAGVVADTSSSELSARQMAFRSRRALEPIW